MTEQQKALQALWQKVQEAKSGHKSPIIIDNLGLTKVPGFRDRQHLFGDISKFTIVKVVG